MSALMRSVGRSLAVKPMAQASHGPHTPPPSARSRPPRAENTAGTFYVDETCIDCDTCRWMAPDVFSRVNGQSAVIRQPEGRPERVRALQALLSCPTFSIHADDRTPDELKEAQLGLPAPIPGVPGVWHCGWHNEASFAATSYFVQHPAGNFLVDTPRFNPVLARQLEAVGGVDYIFLTHKDDVGDHEKWASKFKAVRVLHKGEIRRNTTGVEIQLEGEGPWGWADILNHPSNPRRPASGQPPASDPHDTSLIFTPGHTSHHVCMYHPPTKTLFSGDHLCSPEENGASDRLLVFKDFNWFSFPIQLDSVAKLLQYDWLHVLPGHGRAAHMRDATHRLKAVSELLQQHGRGQQVAVAMAAAGKSAGG